MALFVRTGPNFSRVRTNPEVYVPGGVVQVPPLGGAGFILRPGPAPLERTGRPKCGAGSDNILEPAPFVPGTCATGMPPEAISAKETLHNQLHPEPALGGLFHNLPA